MNRNVYVLPLSFISLAGLASILSVYVLAEKTALHPQFFVDTCKEVLRSVQEHIHFNPNGVLSSLILLTTTVGVSLAIIWAIKFVMSHKRLSSRLKDLDELPGKLKWVINRRHLQNITFSVSEGEPTPTR